MTLIETDGKRRNPKKNKGARRVRPHVVEDRGFAYKLSNGMVVVRHPHVNSRHYQRSRVGTASVLERRVKEFFKKPRKLTLADLKALYRELRIWNPQMRSMKKSCKQGGFGTPYGQGVRKFLDHRARGV